MLSKPKAALYAFGILACYLAVPALFLMIGMFALGLKNAGEIPDTVSNLFSVTGYTVAIIAIAGRFRKKGIKVLRFVRLLPRSMDKVTWLKITVAGFGTGLATSSLLNLIPFPESWMDAYDAASLSSFSTEEGVVMAVLIAVVFLPLSEEFIFRGFIVRTLTRAFSERLSLVIVAAVFALLHLHPLWVFYAFLLGLLLGWAATRLENLTGAILLHFGFNLSSLPFMLARESEWYALVSGSRALICVTGAAGAATALFLLLGMRSILAPSKIEAHKRT
jgi:membrane protease YdiL (CAAX protease family)